jgi:alpha-1,6-mannosyltransferase
MRICDVTIFYHEQSGGVRTYTHEKIRYLARRRKGDAHLMIVPGEKDLEVRHDCSRIQFLKGPVVPFARPYRIILRLVKAYRLLSSFSPDVIEVGCPYIFPWIAFLVRWRTRLGSAGFPRRKCSPFSFRDGRSPGCPPGALWARARTRGAAEGAACRVIGFYHSDFPSAYLCLQGRPLGEISEMLLRQLAFRYVSAVYRRMDLTISPSPAITAFLGKCGVKRVKTVPLGVDTDRFHPRHAGGGRRASLRSRLGLSPGQVLLLFVGRFSKEKGLSCLFRSFELLAQRQPGRYHLLFVGAGPLDRELEDWASPRSDVTVWGYLQGQALAEIYASADIFVSPGTAETFGLTLLEAQASGLPVIAGASGAAPELVAPGAGALIDPGDPEAIAAAAALLAGQDLDVLGRRARRFVDEHYSWNSTFEKLFHEYDHLTAQEG